MKLVSNTIDVVPFNQNQRDAVIRIRRFGWQGVSLAHGNVDPVIEQVANRLHEGGGWLGCLDHPYFAGWHVHRTCLDKGDKENPLRENRVSRTAMWIEPTLRYNRLAGLPNLTTDS